MNCSTPGFSVSHCLLELAQTHVHWVSDAIQPSHPLLHPSLALNFSQHQGLFQWIGFSSGGQGIGASASVLSMNIQGWFPLGLTYCPRDSEESSPTPQFESVSSSAISLLYGPTLISIHDYWKNHSFDCMDLCLKVMSLLFNMLSRLVIAFLPRSERL